MDNILEIRNITLNFGGLSALNKVSLEHTGDEVLSLIGPNGAGKTTLFNLLTGIYRQDEGTIFFKGKDIGGLKPHERVNYGIARTFQNIRLFGELTALENLLVAHPDCNRESVLKSVLFPRTMRSRRKRVVEECEEILSTIGLGDQQNLLATNLPYGKQRLLEIGRALATDPDLILLDEPGAGMNSVEKDELTKLIYHLIEKRRKHIFLIDHDMKFVMNISKRIIVLDHGEKIAEGTAGEIQSNPLVIEAYLGKGNDRKN